MGPRIALGLGNNIDYEIVWETAVFQELVDAYTIQPYELDIEPAIESERALVISILRFLRAGTGGERFVASSEIVEQFAQRFVKKITLGGTSVRAAIAMRKFGFTSALHLVTINEHVRHLIPPDSLYVCSNAHETSYPHLIVQFPQNTQVRAGVETFCAPRANRLIYHCDQDNIRMTLDEGFGALITDARVFLISGFNAMHDQTLLADRLEVLVRMLSRLPADALVFYEDAGFYNAAFSAFIHNRLAGYIDLFSLNEDELQAYLQRQIDLLDAEAVLSAVTDLQRQFAVPTVVVHTRHWALAAGEDAARYALALKAGVTMATTRFRYGDDFTVADYEALRQLPAGPEAQAFAAAVQAQAGGRFCCVPVARVEQHNATTIGLGDAFVGGFLPSLLSI